MAGSNPIGLLLEKTEFIGYSKKIQPELLTALTHAKAPDRCYMLKNTALRGRQWWRNGLAARPT